MSHAAERSAPDLQVFEGVQARRRALSPGVGLKVKAAATALGIHPFMLCKWRKGARDGTLLVRLPKATPAGPPREIARLQQLEREHALLQEEHDLLKKLSGSAPRESGRLRVHPRRARDVRRDARAVLGYRAKAGVHRFFAAHPNLVRRTTTTTIDRVWVGDITYLKVGTTWRYLAVVMDRCSRRILAWTLQRRRDGRVTRGVLAAALRRRTPAPGLIFHSDRGSENLTETLRSFLAAQGVRQSACTTGPGDNAHMESFFHSMKAEATRGRHFATDTELRTVLRDYIRYYNTTRPRLISRASTRLQFSRWH